jgi:hypothetical protein
MSEIADFHNTEYHGQTDGDQAVDAADDQTIEHLLKNKDSIKPCFYNGRYSIVWKGSPRRSAPLPLNRRRTPVICLYSGKT